MTEDLNMPPAAGSNAAAGAPRYHRKNPFRSTLLAHEHLTLPGSKKDTRHFVLSLAGSGLAYTPGDSLAVLARNPPALVDEVIAELGFDPLAPAVGANGAAAPLRDVLQHDYILNRAGKKIVSGLAELIHQGEQRNRLMEIADNAELLSEYLDSRDYVEILRDFNEARFASPDEFLRLLSPIPPRLYSIASSLDAHPGEVHLCVGIVRYTTHGRPKSGLCTGFLADLAQLHSPDVPIYVQPSKSFRLPNDPARDIVMVGPGTGLAPFRAFLEQRQKDGATGRNWLFFGEQHRATDFLYGDELTAWEKSGHLHRLDLAFSRDQTDKIYVQHRMKERAREVWDWLQQGACFYVCGDARRMAKDVHRALIEIAANQGGLEPDAAAHYVEVTLMKTEKRYLRDVY